MKAEIESLIKTSAADLRTNSKDVVEQLLLHFEHQTLFNAISEYMYDSSLQRMEWIICIESLCRIDRIAANKRFIEALQIDDRDKRYRIVRLLRGCGTEHIVPTLMKMLKEEREPGIRYMVALALGMIGDKQAIPALEWSAKYDDGANHDGILVSDTAKEAIEELQSDQEKY